MNSEQYERARELFHELAALPESQRQRAIEAHAPEPEILDYVLALLGVETQGAFEGVDFAAKFGEELVDSSHKASRRAQFEDECPERIGAYRCLRILGVGGMGVVYEAEQESPRRKVALKVIRQVFASGDMRLRFEREARLLGRLQHPGIAHIYEAGSANVNGTAVPYFAMEFIEGLPLMKHAEEHRLDVKDRLELMARVGDAVQHAHARGVIHRDLKPANILVVSREPSGIKPDSDNTPVDSVGQPKVLDFGVARMIENDANSTLQTRSGLVVGTLGYMAPEQIDHDEDPIDVRCDVYALGVILYRLMCGRLPLDLKGKSIPEAARIIRDQDPATLGSLDTQLRGDIETIVAKAMDKDPHRRYANAGELSADLRRHLHDEPISARPASAFYQLAKFTRRNRTLVFGFVATSVSLLVGLIVASFGFYQASSQRDAAVLARDAEKHAHSQAATARDDALHAKEEERKARERLEKIVQFQSRILRGTDVGDIGDHLIQELKSEVERSLDSDRENPGRAAFATLLQEINVTNVARHLLDDVFVARAVRALDEGYTDDPLIEAELRFSTGRLYTDLSMWDEAIQQKKLAVQLRREHLGDGHHQTLLALTSLAKDLRDGERFEESERAYRQALEHRRQTQGEEHPNTLAVLSALGALLKVSGRFEEAESVYRQAIESRSKVLGPTHVATLSTVENLAVLYAMTERTIEALEVYDDLVERRRLAGDVDSLDVAVTLSNMTTASNGLGKFEDSVEIGRRAVAILRKELGDEHETTLVATRGYGAALVETKDFEEAVEVLGRASEACDRAMEAGNDTRLMILHYLARAWIGVEAYEEAEAAFQEIAQHRAEETPLNPLMVALALYYRGYCLAELELPEDAEPILREALGILEANLRDHYPIHVTQAELALVLIELGQEDEARGLLSAAMSKLQTMSQTTEFPLRSRMAAFRDCLSGL